LPGAPRGASVPGMSWVDALHLAVTAAYAGVLWLVQVLVYPQFSAVPPEAFPACHKAHMRRIGWLVGPLMLAEGAAATVAFVVDMPAGPRLLHAASLGLFAAVTLSTFAYYGPLHQRIAHRGHDPVLITRLQRASWARTGLESARLVAVFALSLK